MMKTISTTDATQLRRLLQLFNAESLGEGDLVAGSNVLAAMSASIANLSAPGAGLVTRGGNLLPVGMNFAAVGGLTRSLIGGRVLDPIADIQCNLVDHLAAASAHSAAKLAALPEHERIKIRPAEPNDTPELKNVEGALNGLSLARDSSAFERLLAPCRDRNADELVSNPAVFLDACVPADFMKQLEGAHLRYPYIRATLSDGSGMDRVESLLLSVMRGTSPPSGLTGPTHIRGHVAASCSIDKLARSVEAGEESLLGSVLWLIDGFPSSLDAGTGDEPAPYPTHLKYPEALRRVWGERLDYRRSEGATIRYDWTARQREWVALLQRLEPHCPGVTLAARPLFATLFYGLIKMWEGSKGEPPGWTDTCVFQLAKSLVGRMVQCQQRLLQTDRDVRALALAVKLVPKLVAGPLNVRGIVRKSNRLLVADCREALGVLDRFALIREVDGEKWELTLSATEAVAKLNTLCLDV